MKNLIIQMMFKKVFSLFSQTKLIWLALLMVGTTAHAGVTVRYQHTDTLGSVMMETNASGQMIGSRHQYQPFGQGLNGQKTGLGYTGHLEDTDLGLTYMQQRYYDPVIGRFYSNDPVGFTASNPMMFNRYAYANNNPYKYTDSDGRAPDVIVDAAFTIYDAGQTLGAAAAYAEGVVTGNEALTAVAGEGLASSATNLTMSAGSMLVPGASAPMLRSTSLIKTEVSATKSGGVRLKETYSDGRVKDITEKRVKEFVPNNHPKAPPGTMNKVKFENSQPGSKGFKRDPTNEERAKLDAARKTKDE